MAQSNGDGYKDTISPCCEVEIAREGATFVCSNCGQAIIPEYKLTDETIRLTEMLRAQSNGDDLRKGIYIILARIQSRWQDGVKYRKELVSNFDDFERLMSTGWSKILDGSDMFTIATDIIELFEQDRKQHELDAITFTVTERADISYVTLERLARGDNVGALRQLEQVGRIYAELKKQREQI